MIKRTFAIFVLSILMMPNSSYAKSTKLGASEALSTGSSVNETWENVSSIASQTLSVLSCRSNENCSSDKKCVDGQCVDVCLDNPCSSKTDGRTVCSGAGHVAVCSCDNTTCKSGYSCVSKTQTNGGQIISKRQCEICPEGSSNAQCGCPKAQVADGKGGCKCGGIHSCDAGYKYVYSGSSCTCVQCSSSDATDNDYCNCYSGMHWVSTKARCACIYASDPTCNDTACNKDADCGTTVCNGASHCIVKKCVNGYCKSAECGGTSEWDSCKPGYQCFNPESYENAACVACNNGDNCVSCIVGNDGSKPISGGDGKCYEDCSKLEGYSYNMLYRGCVKDSSQACPDGCSYKSVCTGDLIAPSNDRYVVEVKSKRGTGKCVLCSSVIANCISCQRSSIFYDVVKCTACAEGYEYKNGECVLSPRQRCFKDGLAYDEATDSCYACGDNEIFDVDSGSCYECDKGTFPFREAGVTKCVKCSDKFGSDCISCTVKGCDKCGIQDKELTAYYYFNSAASPACTRCGSYATSGHYCSKCTNTGCTTAGSITQECPSNGSETTAVTIASGDTGNVCYYASAKDMVIKKTTKKSLTCSKTALTSNDRVFSKCNLASQNQTTYKYVCKYKYSNSEVSITLNNPSK